MICPVCHEGEIEGTVDVAPRTHHYPGHREVQITDQTCDCDLSEYDGELVGALAWSREDEADAAYDRHVDDLMEVRP